MQCEDFPCCGHPRGQCEDRPEYHSDYWAARLSELEGLGLDPDEIDMLMTSRYES